MNPWKEKIKQRIKVSNNLECQGLPPDPWVVAFREKNNESKRLWKLNQPKKPPRQYLINSGNFKKGQKKPYTKPLKTVEQKTAYRIKWFSENKERLATKLREKRRIDVGFRISCNLRKRLSTLLSIHLAKKSKQTLVLLGCSMPEFMKHLESKFQSGMNFGNYGEWHIDHKRPCNSFDLTDIKQQEICFHYTNLQPLWAKENRIKSDRILYNAND